MRTMRELVFADVEPVTITMQGPFLVALSKRADMTTLAVGHFEYEMVSVRYSLNGR